MQKKSSVSVGYGSGWIRISMAPRIRIWIRIEVRSWARIRIRIETNADPQGTQH
jgi:hypothetical protein